MPWPQHNSGGGRMPQGHQLNPGGYGSAFNTGIAPNSNVPWANGLATFANGLAENLKQQRAYEQQLKLAALKPTASSRDVLDQKSQDAIKLEQERQKGRLQLEGARSTDKETQQGRMNPGKIFQGISLKYGLTGNAAADQQRFGANYPYIKQQVLAEHSKALGFGTPTDPNYQKIIQSDTFKQSIAAGGAKPPQGADILNPVNPVFPSIPQGQGGTSSATNPDLTPMPQAPKNP